MFHNNCNYLNNWDKEKIRRRDLSLLICSKFKSINIFRMVVNYFLHEWSFSHISVKSWVVLLIGWSLLKTQSDLQIGQTKFFCIGQLIHFLLANERVVCSYKTYKRGLMSLLGGSLAASSNTEAVHDQRWPKGNLSILQNRITDLELLNISDGVYFTFYNLHVLHLDHTQWNTSSQPLSEKQLVVDTCECLSNYHN